MDIQKQQFDPNIRRKVDGQQYDIPNSMTVRLKSEDQALAFERFRRELRDETGNNGNQKTFEAILRLAWQKLEEIDNSNEQFERALNGN